MRETLIAIQTSEEGRRQSLVLLTVDLRQHEGAWVATCIELGTSAYSDTLDELRQEIADAIVLQLNEAERLGFIDDYLQEHAASLLQLPAETPAAKEEHWELVSS